MKTLILSLCVAAIGSTALASKPPIPDWKPVNQVPDWDLSKVPVKRDPLQSEIDCLAKNIYFEARGESAIGQEAVALVTMNRVHDDKWADSVCGVVYEPKQFSWTIEKRYPITNAKAYAKAAKIAERAVKGKIKDFTNGANHYYAYNKVNPKWAKGNIDKIVIGNHVFLDLD